MVLIGPQLHVWKWDKFYICKLSFFFKLASWPLTFICDLWPNENVKVPSLYQYTIYTPSLLPIKLHLIILGHWFYNLLIFDLGIWHLTALTYKRPHKYQFTKFASNRTSTFQMRLHIFITTWPKTTFELDVWPLIASTNVGSHVATMTRLWLKSIKVCRS